MQCLSLKQPAVRYWPHACSAYVPSPLELLLCPSSTPRARAHCLTHCLTHRAAAQAGLVVRGEKTIENRSRRLFAPERYELPFWVLVAASAKWMRGAHSGFTVRHSKRGRVEGLTRTAENHASRNNPESPKTGPKQPRFAQKLDRNNPESHKTGPKQPRFAQNWPKTTQIRPKLSGNNPESPKNVLKQPRFA